MRPSDKEGMEKRVRGSFAGHERKEREKLKRLKEQQKKDAISLQNHFNGWLHVNPAITDEDFYMKLNKFRDLQRKVEKSKDKIEEFIQKQVLL